MSHTGPRRVRPENNYSRVDIEELLGDLVVVNTGPENDDWAGATLRIGRGDDAVEVTIGVPTPRCIMTTVGQQDDLPRQPGVLQAIARINRRTDELGSFACLGAYANVARPGTVRAGDEIVLV